MLLTLFSANKMEDGVEEIDASIIALASPPTPPPPPPPASRMLEELVNAAGGDEDVLPLD